MGQEPGKALLPDVDVGGFKDAAGLVQAITGRAAADGLANPTLAELLAYGQLFNGATWDRIRNNVEVTLLASAARTGTTNTGVQTNHNARGVMLWLNVSANPGGAETLQVKIMTRDPASSTDLVIAAFAATTAAVNGIYGYQLYPGIVDTLAAASFDVQGVALPRSWWAQVVHSGAGSWTYSLAYCLIL